MFALHAEDKGSIPLNSIDLWSGEIGKRIRFRI